MTVIKKLILFWKHPDENHNSLSTKELIILFVLFFPISFLMNFVQNYFSLTYVQGEIFEWKQVLLPTGISITSLILISTYFFLGIIEEFVFRWWLKKKWLGRYFNLFIWLSFIGFVVAHAQPWNLELKYWIYIPVMTLAPFIGGVLLTFIRLQSSVKNSIIFHCTHNLIGVILLLVLGLIFFDASTTDIKIGL